MLSGNGRHRRPRQAPALLVAAGVTGSAIAIPLLGATGASAAEGNVWDKVADCETGGSWSADEGNGRYGGLQLTQDDWEKYGGLDYASSPDLASRSQQIAVAQDILADQGVGAWRTCGLLSGLTKESGSVDLDTGVDEGSPSEVSGSSGLLDSLNSSSSSSSSSSSDSSDSANSSGDSSDSSNPSSGSPDASSDSSDSSKNSSPSSSSHSSSSSADNSSKSDAPADASAPQSPDGSPVETPKSDNLDKSEQGEGSRSLVDTGAIDSGTVGSGRHRGPSADESGASEAAAKSSGRHASYTVRAGDTLASIADSLGLDGGWSALYDANKQAIGTDANHIFPGQTLEVPTK
ncbi:MULTISPECIES: transglycosylase family protein [unclassified Streptomyces]|uniref:LysM peptidoglycan-binding domain-containing protein n=1 Tax=unclassified Streptomyces TaxID=2593676 RepID=UPI002366CD35|nr:MULTISPECIES: transglycosylase family protein [unclassified Streptomyces]MDF3141766.1 transglycosylase family protein [Streptomyces sp. T21Q-yed]WDF38669.1 transglycosylase family protein [Streptomyces sp. T12]